MLRISGASFESPSSGIQKRLCLDQSRSLLSVTQGQCAQKGDTMDFIKLKTVGNFLINDIGHDTFDYNLQVVIDNIKSDYGSARDLYTYIEICVPNDKRALWRYYSKQV